MTPPDYGPPFSRRHVLAASASLPLLGLLPGMAFGQATRPVADAHLHLFNASDLPIENFMKFVLVPRFAGASPPRWARAVIHLFANFYKPNAMTVAREMRGLRDIQSFAAVATAERWTPRRFGEEINRFIDRKAPPPAPPANALADDESTLGESYSALLEAVAEYSGMGEDSAALFSTSPTAGNKSRRDRSLRTAFERVAEMAEAEVEVGLQPAPPAEAVPFTAALASSEACPKSPTEISWARAGRVLGWGYLLLKSRAAHIEEYLARHGTATHRPTLLLNFLVDYDYWLDDEPSPRSTHEQQVELMALLARKYSGRADIRTFAGFCPLRYAVERRNGGPTLFDRFRRQAEEGKIAGFKVYPPMGFQGSGNEAMVGTRPEADLFEPGFAGLRSGLRRWQRPGAGPLAPALDQALDDLFAYCARAGLPVMAHAGPGNEAGPGYGRRANPVHWEAVARKHKVRLSLGHLVNDASHFVAAVETNEQPDCVWSLHGSRRMLDSGATQYQAMVYGDLGYMPELIADPDLAGRFFVALRKAFGAKDRDLTRILYGTDWLMLGHERNNRRYLGAVVAGMERAGYTDTQKDNILYENARRFLGG